MSKLNVVAIQNKYAEELEQNKPVNEVINDDEWAKQADVCFEVYEKVKLDEQEDEVATNKKACSKKSKDNKEKARKRREADIRYKNKVKRNAQIIDANYGKRFEYDCHLWNKRRIGCDRNAGVEVESVLTKSRSDKADKLIKWAEKKQLFKAEEQAKEAFRIKAEKRADEVRRSREKADEEMKLFA